MRSSVIEDYDYDCINTGRLLYRDGSLPRNKLYYESSIALNIPISFLEDDLTNEVLRTTYEKVKAEMYRTNILIIKNVSESFLRNIGSLLDFKYIHTLIFHTGNLNFIPANIFTCIPSLKPEIIYFVKDPSLQVYGDRNNFDNFGNTIPDRVKKIIVSDCSNDIDLLSRMFRQCEIGKFETLSLSTDFYTSLNSPDQASNMYILLKSFKNVKIFLKVILSNNDIELPIRVLLSDSLNINEPIPWKMSYAIILLYKDPLHYNPHEIVQIENTEKYPYIETLVISRSVDCTSLLTPINTETLHNKLTLMTNLTSLHIDYDLILSFKDFCGSLSGSLRTIKIRECFNLKVGDLRYLSQKCQRIECLYLQDIKSSRINLKEILKTFKNVQYVFLQYKRFFPKQNVIRDIKEGDKLKFPPIKFVMITCEKFNSRQLEEIERLEKNTPRKIGQFIFLPDINVPGSSLIYSSFIFQQNSSEFSNINNILHCIW
uniref:F-box domain-containing protein n=1 Tax=Parastrongyloides trichosuri TaxID=131310 RepID=A0A0N5A773_PARTI